MSDQEQSKSMLPMGVQHDTPPLSELTGVAHTVKPHQATAAMDMEVQDPSSGQAAAPTPNASPDGWGLIALGSPHSYREGSKLHVMIVANTMAALSPGSGGFAGQAASEKAGDLGMAGKPVIVNESNPFPVDGESYERVKSAVKGCKWGKIVTLTTRG